MGPHFEGTIYSTAAVNGLMFSGIDILVKTWKDRNWYNGLYKKLVN